MLAAFSIFFLSRDERNFCLRSVQFNSEVEVKTLVEAADGAAAPGSAEAVEISEEKIDYVLHLLHEADPVSVTNESSFKAYWARNYLIH